MRAVVENTQRNTANHTDKLYVKSNDFRAIGNLLNLAHSGGNF